MWYICILCARPHSRKWSSSLWAFIIYMTCPIFRGLEGAASISASTPAPLLLPNVACKMEVSSVGGGHLWFGAQAQDQSQQTCFISHRMVLMLIFLSYIVVDGWGMSLPFVFTCLSKVSNQQKTAQNVDYKLINFDWWFGGWLWFQLIHEDLHLFVFVL